MRREIQVASVDELISRLEPVDPGEISSDIRANVRAELKRIRRNVSLILGFLASVDTSENDSEFKRAIAQVHKECLVINATVSRMLILQTLRADRWIDYTSRMNEQYAAMAESARTMFSIAVPLRVHDLANAM